MLAEALIRRRDWLPLEVASKTSIAKATLTWWTMQERWSRCR